jgi:hypothetical protein
LNLRTDHLRKNLPKELEGMKAEYSTVGVHPNETGYEVMEPLAEKAISKALTQKVIDLIVRR